MPISDDAQILQVPLKAQGAKADDWSAVRINDLTQLNSILRQMQEQVNKLNGRTGDSAIRSGLSVAGGVSASGTLVGGGAILGGVDLTPRNVSQAPTVESALAPVDLYTTNGVGAAVPSGAASPFTIVVKDEFFGTTSAPLTGDLGWAITNGTMTPLVEEGHLGAVNYATGAGPVVARITLNPLLSNDVGYLAAVVRGGTAVDGINYAFGFTTSNPNGGVEVAQGVYWSYLPATSLNWRTITRTAGVTTANTTDVPVLAENWYLLEIVCAISAESQVVDFYINRTRAARHTTDIPVAATSTPIFICQEIAGANRSLGIDTFILAGKAPLGAKRWT
jgi:hypothetical protein